MNKDRRSNGQSSQPVPCAPAVSSFQKVGQGRNAGAKIKGGKKQCHNNQEKWSHPFKITVCKPVHVPFFCEAHHMYGRYIRRKERHTDYRPGQGVPGQEVIRAARITAAF